MHEKVIRNSRAGFGYNDTLLSRLKFSGIITIWEISKVEKHLPEDTIIYWSIKDEYGARMSCFEESLVRSLRIGERFEVSGEVKIGKGGIFLNLKHAAPMNGQSFTEEILPIGPEAISAIG